MRRSILFRPCVRADSAYDTSLRDDEQQHLRSSQSCKLISLSESKSAKMNSSSISFSLTHLLHDSRFPFRECDMPLLLLLNILYLYLPPSFVICTRSISLSSTSLSILRSTCCPSLLSRTPHFIFIIIVIRSCIRVERDDRRREGAVTRTRIWSSGRSESSFDTNG